MTLKWPAPNWRLRHEKPNPRLDPAGGSRASLASSSLRDISNLADDTSQAEQTHSTGRNAHNMFPTQIRRAEPFPQYRSPYGPKYGFQPHVAGVTGKQFITFGTKAAGLGGVALFAVIFYASGIPRVQRDILQRVPFLGSYFINEIPPEDNDEVFHIPQAQKYCQAKWLEWDDKITTPPGLYAVSVLIHRALWFMNGKCSETSLRMTNWVAIIILTFTAVDCRRLVEKRLAERSEARPRTSSLSFHAIHTGMNIGLFPLLFFFSALYYTDVFSTLMVLFAFQNHLERVGPEAKSWWNDFFVIFLGVAALFMRQTNVFWVVVFMGGLEAVEAAKAVPDVRPQPPGQGDSMANIKYFAWRSSLGDIHDPALNQASLDDALYCVVSIAIAVICNPLRVAKQVWAHIAVMALFVAFVLWNGSVVLGATQKAAEAQQTQKWYAIYLSIAGYISLTLAALAIVHFNTIIHPFTLADNRHYMFYVFRYTILRSKWVRYALVPVYVLCWNICWNALGGSRPTQDTADAARKDAKKQANSSHKKSVQIKDTDAILPVETPTLSTALLWLAATALSLITAPLVEPRYFIMPWVFWRLLVPAWPANTPIMPSKKSESSPGRLGWILSLGQRFDLRLFVETAWFLAVHLATAYMFTARPYYWRAEDGTLLDGGRVQRFMW
ncbi:hypothetical protein J7T55_013146 [Diaporthe amygdali]|uniref:uncharacterized protein n=1 Tax=Phomopsis amygdali TaxID=1214568 RepID=UPI0022FE1DDA|nr:uncharacterized protein J7T55_013146 [Diaporthe amygdali]KAJ0118890.1 hypothetical protein J7T55_013146 [Diaporthe amygdali]